MDHEETFYPMSETDEYALEMAWLDDEEVINQLENIETENKREYN